MWDWYNQVSFEESSQDTIFRSCQALLKMIWNGQYDERLLFVAGILDKVEGIFVVRTARDATDKNLERWENAKW